MDELEHDESLIKNGYCIHHINGGCEICSRRNVINSHDYYLEKFFIKPEQKIEGEIEWMIEK